ncbi:hypothetical protein OTU49_001838 [Cherax quadricarinatus]|uniref:Uncharacterized protein n=1 Tax=Cherax quadricarinatus TaxID=27406 RepID=A0AAW0XHD6_CHEQU
MFCGYAISDCYPIYCPMSVYKDITKDFFHANVLCAHLIDSVSNVSFQEHNSLATALHIPGVYLQVNSRYIFINILFFPCQYSNLFTIICTCVPSAPNLLKAGVYYCKEEVDN